MNFFDLLNILFPNILLFEMSIAVCTIFWPYLWNISLTMGFTTYHTPPLCPNSTLAPQHHIGSISISRKATAAPLAQGMEEAFALRAISQTMQSMGNRIGTFSILICYTNGVCMLKHSVLFPHFHCACVHFRHCLFVSTATLSLSILIFFVSFTHSLLRVLSCNRANNVIEKGAKKKTTTGERTRVYFECTVSCTFWYT